MIISAGKTKNKQNNQKWVFVWSWGGDGLST